ncbi:MAG: S-methyl-5-thioribose-1-phosphate isomerase [Bythopirellula sp.]|nr:S-methyl-5-thioribose-1-phosphate isomerase [Bythopirellula sp.]
MSLSLKPLHWQGDIDGHLILLDQTRLPGAVEFLECFDVDQVWIAIQELSVRGAPAIGIAAAFGVCLGAQAALDADLSDMQRRVNQVCDYLATSRPTAVNLFWALERMRNVAKQATSQNSRELATVMLAEARAIHQEDAAMCAVIGTHGADLLADLPQGAGILTHCNTGALATGGEGTALAVIFELARREKRPRVWVDETRPLLQGARLTTFELMDREIDCTLICDNMAAHVMQAGMVQAVIVGADRIAANGDTANKIGTYGVAVLARAHGIPFYVAAPTSTFDPAIASGSEIPIEQRAGREIVQGFGKATAPDGVAVYNPAFDVTPATLISGIITEQGVVLEPTTERITKLLT